MVMVTQAEDGRTVAVQPAGIVEARLPELASAGYRWELDAPDPAVLAVEDSKADYPGPAIGGSGEAVFRLRALGPGVAVLRFRLRRSWEADAVRTCTVIVEVRQP